MSPEHCLKLERWQVPPHINKVMYESYETVKTKIVCLLSLFSHKTVNEELSLLIKISSPPPPPQKKKRNLFLRKN